MKHHISHHDKTFRIRTRRLFHLITIFYLLTYFSATYSFIIPVYAQTPATVSRMAYAASGEEFLYIQGGITSVGTVINQFVALDLSVSTWQTSNPPWKWIQAIGTSSPAPTASSHSMTMSNNLLELYIWNPSQPRPWSTFRLNGMYWDHFTNVRNNTITNQPGVRNGVDMSTGYVWVPFGNNNGQEMFMNIPGTTSLPLFQMPSNLIPQPVIYESFVWSTLRKSFLLYGGKSLDGTTGNPRLTEFNANTQWSAVETTGTSPGDVSGHCMVPAYEGRKMVVFGGAGLDNIAKDSIYILDLVTQVWTPGNGAGPEQARTNMACVVSGDSFIAWGGESGGKVKDGKPIVYDMKNKQWTQEFKRSIVQTTPTGPNTTNEPKPSSGPSNTAAIAGGIAGGLALAGVIIGFFIYKRRDKQKKNKHERTQSQIPIIPMNGENGSDNDDNKNPSFHSQLHTGQRSRSMAPPLLAPRPVDKWQGITVDVSSTLSGPQAILRHPQGQQPHHSSVSINDMQKSILEITTQIPKPGPQDTSHWTQPRPFSQNLDRSQYVNRNHYQGVNTYDRNDLSGPQDTTHWMQPHPLSQNLGHDQYVSQNIYQDVNAYDRSDRGRNPQEDEALMRSYIPS